MAKADLERARELYPSTRMDEREWLEVFSRNEDIMWAIVGDIYSAVKDEEARDAGVRRVGRRPARSSTSLEDVWSTVFPKQYTMDPFPEALGKLMGERSIRAFALKIPCHYSTLSRLRAGLVAPDMAMLESIAAAAKVSPSYFVEWRAMYVGALITRVLTEQPNMGITALRVIRTGRRNYESEQTDDQHLYRTTPLPQPGMERGRGQ